MGFHLSDNNITNQPFFLDILKEFDITETDVAALDKKSSNPNQWDKDDFRSVDHNPRSKYKHLLDDFYGTNSGSRKENPQHEACNGND